MPLYNFTAKDLNGSLRKGITDAPSTGEVISQIRDRGWFVLDIRLKNGEPSDARNDFQITWKKWLPIRAVDIEISLKQLAMMLKGGMSLLPALEEVSRQAMRPSVSNIWSEIAKNVQGGMSLANAMSKQNCFSSAVIQLVVVGEQSACLDSVLKHASLISEKRRSLRNNFIHALAYPALILLLAIGAVIFMVVSVLPKIERFLRTLNRALPPLTQSLIDVTHWIYAYGFFIVLAGFVLFLSLLLLYWWPTGRYWLDRLVLRLPIIGPIFRLSGTIFFSRTMSILLKSGLTISDSLRTVSKLHHNKYLVQQINVSRECVLHGTSLSRPLSQRHAYMPLLSKMVVVGEGSGNLEGCLNEVADFYENQLDLTIRWLGTISVPLVIVIIGCLIGFIYIAFFVSILGGVSQRLY